MKFKNAQRLVRRGYPEQALSLELFRIESEIPRHQPEHQRNIIRLLLNIVSLMKLLQLFTEDVSCVNLPFSSTNRCNFIQI